MNKLTQIIRHTYAKLFALLIFFLLNTFASFAQTETAAATTVQETSLWSSPLFWVFALAIIGLLLVIIVIGSVLVGLVNNKLSEKSGKILGLVILIALFSSNSSFAQSTETATTNTTVEAVVGGLDPNTIIVLSIVVIIELFVILYLFSILQKILITLGYKKAQESKWSFSSIYKSLTKSIPVEHESDFATEHNYDGIVELDNSLPPWWVYMFYATIVFSIVYMVYFHWAGGPTQLKEYEQSIELAQQQKIERLKNNASNVDENSVVALTEAPEIAKGKSSYTTKCAACHGQNGEGGVGPNLTDDYWLHGGGVKNIFKTIKYGVPEKGMVSWQAQMQPAEMQQVTSYILTLKGSNPANAKAPQGDLYKEEAVAVDSSAAKSSVDTTVVASTK